MLNTIWKYGITLWVTTFFFLNPEDIRILGMGAM
jgi:hypothetical protein